MGASTDAAYPVIGGAKHIAYRNGVHYDAVIPLSAEDGATMGRDQDADDSAMADIGDVEERTHDIETGKKAKGTLRIIFWNSNGWEQERCEKIAEVALEEEADAICVLDARMHPARKEHMKGYEGRLERVTGKTWKGKVGTGQRKSRAATSEEASYSPPTTVQM